MGKKKKKGLKRAANGAMVPAKGYKYTKGGKLVKAGGHSMNGLGTTGAKASSASFTDKGMYALKVGGGIFTGIIAGRALENFSDAMLVKPESKAPGYRFISPGAVAATGAAATFLLRKGSFLQLMGIGAMGIGLIDCGNVGLSLWMGEGSPQIDDLDIMKIVQGNGSDTPTTSSTNATNTTNTTTSTASSSTKAMGQVKYLQLPGSVDLPTLDRTMSILGPGADFDVDRIL